MRKFNRILAAVLVMLALTVVIAPALAKAASVPGDVYGIPACKLLVIEMTIGSTTIKIDGAAVTIDAAPQIRSSRTFAPIAPIIYALGGTIVWDAATQKVTIVVGTKTMVLTIGNGYAIVNGKSVAIDSNPAVVPWILAPGRTMLPVRFIAEQFSGFVMWNAVLQLVTLIFVKS